MKFPMKKGVRVVHGDQAQAQTCYVTSASTPKASEDSSMSRPLEFNTIYQVEDAECSNLRNLRVLGELDPRDHQCRRVPEPVEALRPYKLSPECLER
ncbi:hypothetical protein TorRG33x02_357330 [Trema orientale]|uniref:Uncharacterized protein n=1 Tax=Trema orientale TaxID=63057 RepID=A0A2P5A5E0_TREOI|nr:hypothetical protein TorRG33x02_357330 [Trema orientale]